MEIKLHTETTFDAAHHLLFYDGNCARAHGHTWRVTVDVVGQETMLGKVGILWDFANLKKLVKKELDHQDLNKVFGFNPTSENIALWFLRQLSHDYPKLKFIIRVYESQNSYAEVSCE